MQPLFSLFFPSSPLRVEFTMIKEIIAALDIVNQFLPTMFGSVSSFFINLIIYIKYVYVVLFTYVTLTYLYDTCNYYSEKR